MKICNEQRLSGKTRAFTLIELLVVIAIIAILAAILFPVFAQAKVAAKKAASLTQMKQEGLSVMIYATDYDDSIPLTFFQDGNFAFPELFISTPADVFEGDLPENVRAFSVVYPNSTEPYRKNAEILAAPGITNWKSWWSTFPMQKQAWRNGHSINGLLNSFPISAVNRPSQLPLFTQLLGDRNLDGMALNTPTLACQYTTPCRFQRVSSPDCQGAAAGPGTASKVQAFPRQYDDSSSVWVYGKGQNWVNTDTSAKFRRLGSHIDGFTDYRVDPFWDYSEKGSPGGYWMEEGQCFHLGFAPDFDFETWGTPYPGIWEVIQW